MDWTDVFAYPLPWRKGRSKGRAAYMRRMEVYHSGWVDLRGTKAIGTFLDEGSIKEQDVKHDALEGRILLRRCTGADDVKRFIDEHHFRASHAAHVGRESVIVEMEEQFKEYNAMFLNAD